MGKKMVNYVVVLFIVFSICMGGVTIAASTENTVDWKSELHDWSGKTLRIIMVADPWIDAFYGLNKQFEALTGVKIEMASYGYDQAHEKQILEATQNSSTYDVVVMDSVWVGEFAEIGFAEDLTPWIAETRNDIIAWDDYEVNFREVPIWKDKVVGLPFSPYYILYYYRSDLFEAEGLNPPKTYDEVLDIAKTFTNNDKYPGVYGIAMNNRQGSPVGQAYFEYIYNFGGKPFESTYPGSDDPYSDMTPLLNSPESIAVVNYFKECLQYQPPGALNFAWDERVQLFASGMAAQFADFNLRAPILINPDRSIVSTKFGASMIPSKKDVRPVAPLGGYVMGMNSNSINKELAWDYIKWFCAPDTHKEFVKLSGVPARYSAMDDPELNEKYWWFPTLKEAAATSYADCRPRIPEAQEIIGTIGLWISRALTGELETEEAMNKANEEVRNLLKNRGYPMSH